MDLDDEWEFLPDTRYVRNDYDHDLDAAVRGGDLLVDKRVFHHHHRSPSPAFAAKSIFNMNYFSDPSPKLLIIPTPVHFRSPSLEAEDVVKRLLSSQDKEKDKAAATTDDELKQQSPDAAEAASQVFFKNNFLKGTDEFVDMMKIVDSPRSRPAENGSSLIGAEFRFDEKSVDDDQLIITSCSPKHNKSNNTKFEFEKNQQVQVVMKNDMNWIGEGIIGDELMIDDCGDDGLLAGLNLCKLGFGGIRAICSLGVAAATICILMFGNNHNKAKQHNHKLRFQIYADDKRINQVVQQAAKINEAMSAAVRGVSLNRAHITYGGYYDGAL